MYRGGSVICTTAEGKWGLYRTVPTPLGMASVGSNHSYLTHCIGYNFKYTTIYCIGSVFRVVSNLHCRVYLYHYYNVHVRVPVPVPICEGGGVMCEVMQAFVLQKQDKKQYL
jgi:hypothetical protein